MSPLVPQNPFYDRAAVRDPERLIGRNEEIAFIYDLIRNKQCVSIVGTLRIGKSTVLQLLGRSELQRRVEYDLSDFLFIHLDFTDYQQQTQEGFFQDVCRQITTHCQLQVADFVFSTADWFTRFRDLLQHVNNAGRHIVLLLDSFDKITGNENFDLFFFSYLRSLAIRNIVYYVTASVKPLAKVCHRSVKSSPFFLIFKECQLGAWKLDEVEQFITSRMQGISYYFTASELEWIIERAGRNPYFLQITCSVLFDEKVRRGVAIEQFGQVQDQVYRELLPIFENIWYNLAEEPVDSIFTDNLSKEQCDLKEEVRRRSSPKRLRKMPELSESQLMRKYICDLLRINIPAITVDDLREVLANQNNIEVLSNSKLADTCYVTVLYEREISNAPVKKGKFVLDFIKKAHEEMKPGGLRTDSATEWRMYNILYYHYLQHRLTSEQISARIGVRSTRTFHRYQNDALVVLLEKICAMETAVLKGELL